MTRAQPIPLRMAPGRAAWLRVVSGDEAEPAYPKCSLFLRGGARLLDVAVAWAIDFYLGPAGKVAALLYLLLADGLLRGQSIGKRMFGIKVVHLPSGIGAGYRESVLRNAPFGLVLLFAVIPRPLGPYLAGAAAVVVGAIEALRVVRDSRGLRLGDAWATTQVVDGKVATGLPVGTRQRRVAEATGRAREGQSSFTPTQTRSIPCG